MAKITEYQEALGLDQNDVFLKDGTGGTKKIKWETLKDIIAPIDNTLTEAGKAADAKEVGDKVTELKSAANDIIRNTQNELIYGNAYDILSYYERVNKTQSRVTFTWDASGNSCTISTNTSASGLAVCNLFYSSGNNLPVGMLAGGTYRIKYNAENVKLQVIGYAAGSESSTTILETLKDAILVIPADIVRITIRLAVASGATANETVTPKIYTETLTNKEIQDSIDYDLKSIYNNPKSFSLGLVIKGKLNPNGANATDDVHYTRTEYIAFAENMICYMDNPNYNYCIWGYPNQSISGRVDAYTNSVYVSGDSIVMIRKTANSRYFRIGFTRKDGATLTTDLADPTSDFSVITAALHFYSAEAYDIYPTGTSDPRTTEITDILNNKGSCSLAPGDYYISRFYMPADSILKGAGASKTRLISTTNESYGIRMRTNATISDLTLEHYEESTPTPTDNYSEGIHGIQIGDTGSSDTGHYNCTLNNVIIKNFSGCGVFMMRIGQGENGAFINNVRVQYCSVGFYFGQNAEYNNLQCCKAIYCYTGAIVKGGNNILSECIFGDVEIGINLMETDAYGSTNNDAHGVITGCKVTHTGTYSGGNGISFKSEGQASGELIDGCMFASFVYIKDRGKGLQFSGCQFRGSNDITIDNSIVQVLSSVFATGGATGITVLNGGKFIRTGCVDFDGNVLASVT